MVTYNIHKGVRGIGPVQRLEIHNLGKGIESLKADVVFLQEVRAFHHRQAIQFANTSMGWPEVPQAEFLAPDGYEVAYRTNAYTKFGEHGNALLSRWPLGDCGHHDVSDHRFEQRGLLHVPLWWRGQEIHAIVVHFGLVHASRVRQVKRLQDYVAAHVPPHVPLMVAGDFNDWGERLDGPMNAAGLLRACCGQERSPVTFPSRVPVFSLDRVYTRGLSCVKAWAPRGTQWAKMSDHLPLVVELILDSKGN